VRNYFNKLKFGIVLIGFIGSAWVSASSFDQFFKALHFDKPEEIRALLARGFDPNSVNEKGIPAIHVAIEDRALKSASVLVAHPQFKLEITNAVGETPLMLAAIFDLRELAHQLVERGADVNRPGWTPLHYASVKGRIELMRLLIDKDAYLDAESPTGDTPLMLAVRDGNPRACKLLLEEGADPTLVNPRNNHTAQSLAEALNKTECERLIVAFTAAWEQNLQRAAEAEKAQEAAENAARK